MTLASLKTGVGVLILHDQLVHDEIEHAIIRRGDDYYLTCHVPIPVHLVPELDQICPDDRIEVSHAER